VKVKLYQQACPITKALTLSFEQFPENSSISINNGPEFHHAQQSQIEIEVPDGSRLLKGIPFTVLLISDGTTIPPQELYALADLGKNGFRIIN
jgi:hypothetical protein